MLNCYWLNLFLCICCSECFKVGTKLTGTPPADCSLAVTLWSLCWDRILNIRSWRKDHFFFCLLAFVVLTNISKESSPPWYVRHCKKGWLLTLSVHSGSRNTKRSWSACSLFPILFGNPTHGLEPHLRCVFPTQLTWPRQSLTDMEICFSGGCNSPHVDHHHNQPLYFLLCISILFSVENQFKRHHDQGTYIKKNICCGLNSHKRKHLFGVQSIIIMARYGGM